MKPYFFLLVVLFAAARVGAADEIKDRTVDVGQKADAPSGVSTAKAERDARADARMDEMRRKIVAAVEEILITYGNPAFAEVITNDPVKAAELRRRIADTRSGEELQRAVAALTQQREELKNDIALRERELEQLRLRAGKLRGTIDQAVNQLQRVQQGIESENK